MLSSNQYTRQNYFLFIQLLNEVFVSFLFLLCCYAFFFFLIITISPCRHSLPLLLCLLLALFLSLSLLLCSASCLSTQPVKSAHLELESVWGFCLLQKVMFVLDQFSGDNFCCESVTFKSIWIEIQSPWTLRRLDCVFCAWWVGQQWIPGGADSNWNKNSMLIFMCVQDAVTQMDTPVHRFQTGYLTCSVLHVNRAVTPFSAWSSLMCASFYWY